MKARPSVRRRRSPRSWATWAPAFRSPPIGMRPARGCSRLSGTCPRPWRSLPTSSARPPSPIPELHRQQIAALGRLTQIRNEPTVLASLAATQLLYGYDHPYGHPQWGNPGIIKGLKPADLKRFYETHVRPEQAAVIAVGDIALEELKQQLEAAAGNLEVGLARAGRARFRLAAAEADAAGVDRQAARGPVGDPPGLGRCPAEHGRFLPAERDEHGFRRAVLQPFEPELAGAEGLHLRRPQRLGLARQRARAVRGHVERADGGHRAGLERVSQGVRRHGRRPARGGKGTRFLQEVRHPRLHGRL